MNQTDASAHTHAEENIEKLKAKLRELFQLDRGDLDFGLYRIMSLKRDQVCEFLDEQLLPQVTEALGDIAETDTTSIQEDLDEAIKDARRHTRNVDDSPLVQELRKKLNAAKLDSQIEADTYNHLYNFFARYYDEGDFMSLRRYKSAGKESYAIPYNGEEVKLHWANADQYYIKTTENYASYVFTADQGGKGARVRFEIAAADNEKDNIKEANGKDRFFVLAKDFIAEQENLTIRFEHRPLNDGEKNKYPKNGAKRQGEINADAEARIKAKLSGKSKFSSHWLGALAAPCPTECDAEHSVLGKHLAAYTAKNSFDYFIHKDLGGFLRRELDYYLKNDVISIDNLELADDPFVFMRGLAQVKAIKTVGNKIIDFLAQLEDFQKQLWLKKKFVLETNYCVTLDKIPESLYAEIAKNKAQRDEWVQLFATDEIGGGKKLTAKFLKENPHLVLDTKHFDQAFTDKLLAALSDHGSIEEQMNGLLIHGENFQALNLLQEKYQEQVKCVHIDPPYNTKTSGFIYKNNYKHSSWLAMMENRISISLPFISGAGSFLCHIDENEYERLHFLFKGLPIFDAGTVVWDKKHPMLGGGGVATQHEYIIWMSKTERAMNLGNGNIQLMLTQAQEFIEENWNVVDEGVRKKYAKWVKNYPGLSGGERAHVLLDDDGRIYQSISLSAPELRADPKFFVALVHPATKKPCAVPPNGFSRTPETMQGMIERREILFGKNHSTQPRRKRFLSPDSRRQITSVFSDATRGKADLDALGLEQFPYSHSARFYGKLIEAAAEDPSDIVLDHFAGSGTTGHAVVNLNREDNGNRKYILVEVGHHFDTVLLPRMKKVAYSKDWKDGKPQNREGISQLFQYIRLESYEDALDSLVPDLSSGPAQTDMVESARRKKIIEDYQLRYALGEETAKSATLLGQDFINPFDYTLSVVRDGVRRDEKADIVETFNFLLGLQITSRRRIDDVLTIRGTTANNQNCLILWRNLEQIDAAKLDEWFAKHRKDFGDDLDLIYVNGDNTLAALGKGERWEVVITELAFRELMFGGEYE
ncbi:MAG: site-specific DNA-methyltransferase [Gammaproteobacteria bacterium]